MSAPWIIVPVKRFSEAKRRLAPVADPAERAAIARVMSEHVLQELSKVSDIGGVLVVSAEPAMKTVARRHGFELLAEAESAGLNSAVRRADRMLRLRGLIDLGVVLADLPLFDAAALSRVLACHAQQGEQHLTLVTDQHGDGTNVRICRSRQALPMAYGLRSALRHHAAAAARGIHSTIVRENEVFADLDTVDDVAQLLAGAFEAPLRELLQGLTSSHV
jgi:2-phospho-L-lactate guanylyltransferase